jgi:hypothetical protein
MAANRLAVVVLALIVLIVVAIGVLGLLFALRTSAPPDSAATANAVGTSVALTLNPGGLPTGVISVATATQSAGVTAPPAATPIPAATTALPPTPLPSFTPPARSNGALIIAQRRNAPVVDGLLSDWSDWPYRAESAVFRPENWTGAADLNVQFALAWDEANLYLAAIVTDDAFVQTQRGEALFRGDSVEMLFDADLAGDFSGASLNGDDFQLGLSPGTNSGDGAEAWLWFPRAAAGVPVNVVVASQQTALGYTCEAQIPWAMFGLRPAGGQRFGFALSASDNDSPGAADQQSMVSSVNTRRLSDPTTWGTLELGQ